MMGMCGWTEGTVFDWKIHSVTLSVQMQLTFTVLVNSKICCKTFVPLLIMLCH